MNYIKLVRQVGYRGIDELRTQVYKLHKDNMNLKKRGNEFSLSSDQVQELLHRIENLEKVAQEE